MKKYLIIAPSLGDHQMGFVTLDKSRKVPFTFMLEYATRFYNIEDAELTIKKIDYLTPLSIIEETILWKK